MLCFFVYFARSVIFHKKSPYNSFILYIDFMAAPWYNERAADARCGPVPGLRAYMAIFPSCLDLGPATWIFPEYRDPCHMDLLHSYLVWGRDPAHVTKTWRPPQLEFYKKFCYNICIRKRERY